MRWASIAREDLVESRRDRSLYAVLVLFVLAGGLAGWLLGEITDAGASSDLTFPIIFLQLMGVLVPLVAVGITYDSIVGRRAVGSLHLLLGLPFVRRDVVLGTYVGRTLLALLGTAVGVLVIGIVSVLIGGSAAIADPVAIAVAFLLVAALAVVFTGIALAFSMTTRSTTIAGTGGFLVLVLLVFMWGVFVRMLVFLANRLGLSGPDPAWVTFVHALNPHNAFKALASTQFVSFEGIGTLLTAGGSFYQTPAFAALVLVGWAVLVPGLAFLSFRSADL